MCTTCGELNHAVKQKIGKTILIPRYEKSTPWLKAELEMLLLIELK